MEVKLISYTQDAVDILVFTKSTRLNMTAAGFDEIKKLSEEEKLSQLEYMRHTIQSQFEFVDYIFAINGVSRAFTHQLIRHRIGTSFAQQSQRTVNMDGFDYVIGPSVDYHEYHDIMKDINDGYNCLIAHGAKVEDARGVLPTNICTNIIFKANLRTLHDMALKRLCIKTQGEFQNVFRAMRNEVLNVHPWAEPFIRVHCAVYGNCQFHTFPISDCPVKSMVYNPHAGESYGGGVASSVDEIQKAWNRYEI